MHLAPADRAIEDSDDRKEPAAASCAWHLTDQRTAANVNVTAGFGSAIAAPAAASVASEKSCRCICII